MKLRFVAPALIAALLAVASSSVQAGLFSGGCSSCEPTCGAPAEPACGAVADPACGCDVPVSCCDAPVRKHHLRGLLSGLHCKIKNRPRLLHCHANACCEASCGAPACEASCGAAEPACGVAEPACGAAAEASCGCGAPVSCCDAPARKHHLRGLLNGLHCKIKNRPRLLHCHADACCEASCGAPACEASCGAAEPTCGCN